MENSKDPRKEAGQNLPGGPTRDPSTPPKGFPWKTMIGLLVLLVIVVVVAQRQKQGSGKSAAAAKGDPPPVAVIIGTVAQEGVPIFLDGLGTVQAFNSVTVR